MGGPSGFFAGYFVDDNGFSGGAAATRGGSVSAILICSLVFGCFVNLSNIEIVVGGFLDVSTVDLVVYGVVIPCVVVSIDNVLASEISVSVVMALASMVTGTAVDREGTSMSGWNTACEVEEVIAMATEVVISIFIDVTKTFEGGEVKTSAGERDSTVCNGVVVVFPVTAVDVTAVDVTAENGLSAPFPTGCSRFEVGLASGDTSSLSVSVTKPCVSNTDIGFKVTVSLSSTLSCDVKLGVTEPLSQWSFEDDTISVNDAFDIDTFEFETIFVDDTFGNDTTLVVDSKVVFAATFVVDTFATEATFVVDTFDTEVTFVVDTFVTEATFVVDTFVTESTFGVETTFDADTFVVDTT